MKLTYEEWYDLHFKLISDRLEDKGLCTRLDFDSVLQDVLDERYKDYCYQINVLTN